MDVTNYLRSILSVNDILAAGKIPGAKVVKKFGFNPAVGATKATVWDGGGLYPWPTSAQALTVSSSSGSDTINGVGARTVIVTCLDINYIEYEIEVELNGQNPVPVLANGYRVHRVQVHTAGSTGAGVGTIYVGYGAVSVGVPATKLAVIIPTANQTKMAIYTVPAGKAAFVHDYYNNLGEGKDAVIESYSREVGSVFQLKRVVSAYQNNFHFPNNYPFFVDEKTDIDIRAISTAAGAPVSAGFDMLIVDKDKFL